MTGTAGTADSLLVHGTTIALGDVGVLLRGGSGAGKSDLALRFLAEHGRWPFAERPRLLVADDQTRLSRKGDQVLASAVGTIAGKIEVRGLGIIDVPHRPWVPLGLVVDLVAPTDVERMPEDGATMLLLGCPVACCRLAPFESSAVIKLALTAGRVGPHRS